ncbi:MAG: FAD-dependent oxidoreductase [Desulfobacterales bacterium]|nr:FAD-dependent oxidoreductase [Desulfobacterales bacterium]
MKKKRLLIVGGVAGGASCAARARRLSEFDEIIIFERGPYISFANCGLPYYVGNVIAKEDDLLVATPELFDSWFNIEVRTGSDVIGLSPRQKEIEVKNLKTGEIYREKYDALVISPGASPVIPGLEGINLPGIFTLRTIPDLRNIIQWIHARDVRQAVIVGGGFIGLEMAENLHRRGIHVTIVEMQAHVMPVLDPEMAMMLHGPLRSQGIALCLGSSVTGFKSGEDNSIDVHLASGKTVSGQLVLLAVGVRPETRLAAAAGIEIGPSGGIVVNEHMRTSDENIWAVGDAVEVKNFITGSPGVVALAGPANRQGRTAAAGVTGSLPGNLRFRGSQATAVCGVLGMTIASTGVTEKMLLNHHGRGADFDFEKIYLHPDHHASYYPDAKKMTIKLLFSKPAGRLLGAQAVGLAGVEQRSDVSSMAIGLNGTVFDLEEAELCYAPQYGSAKDPVNMAGMIAANVLRGISRVRHWHDINKPGSFILDVREPHEFAKGHVKGAMNIPLGKLRQRLQELPRQEDICIYCQVGKRSYNATRILSQHGFKAYNLSGGFLMYQAFSRTVASGEDFPA